MNAPPRYRNLLREAAASRRMLRGELKMAYSEIAKLRATLQRLIKANAAVNQMELFAAMDRMFDNLKFDPPAPGEMLPVRLVTPEQFEHLQAWCGTNWPPDRLGVDGDEGDEA